MEITGITRLVDGKEQEQFVVGCAEHGYWYKRRPPLVSCRECWTAYFVGQWAEGGSKPEHLEQLESAIRHTAEAIDKGTWDFKPSFEMKIEHEN